MTTKRFTTFAQITMCVLLSNLGVTNAQEVTKKADKELERNKATKVLITQVLLSNYKAMEEKRSKDVIKLYHPNSNLPINKAQLDQYFAQVDMSYAITDIRYVGNDGKNYVITYREKTDFRKKGQEQPFEKVDAEVLMVFRSDEGKFKIFTSNSLNPLAK